MSVLSMSLKDVTWNPRHPFAKSNYRSAENQRRIEEHKASLAADGQYIAFPARKVRATKTREEQQKIRGESLRLQQERKAEEARLKKERDAKVTALVDARRADDINKMEDLKVRLDANKKAAAEQEADRKANAPAFEERVEERKRLEAKQRKEDAYLPVRREVERICHALEGEYRPHMTFIIASRISSRQAYATQLHICSWAALGL